jgi:hypothetical protein
LQDAIKALCRKLLETSDDDEAISLARELQMLTHQHLEKLRLQVLTNMGKPAPSPEEVIILPKSAA